MLVHVSEIVRFTPQELKQRVRKMTFDEREAETLQLYAEYLKSEASQVEPAPVPTTVFNEPTE